jgi:hypothetical protein
MALQIGFATMYYTLWDVSTENVYTTVNGIHFLSGVKVNYVYLKNISQDWEKVKEAHPGIPFNEDLRGESRSWEEVRSVVEDFPVNWFTFGKLKGSDINTSDDVWQLNRAMHEELGGRRKVLARRRLQELGHLELYPHRTYAGTVNVNWNKKDSAGNWLPELLQEKLQFRRFALKSEVNSIKEREERASRVGGHFFAEREKVAMELREVDRFSFSGTYGSMTVVTYVDRTNRVFKYVGSSPVSLNEDGFNKLKATIKHSRYNDQDETHLLRMKVIS